MVAMSEIMDKIRKEEPVKVHDLLVNLKNRDEEFDKVIKLVKSGNLKVITPPDREIPIDLRYHMTTAPPYKK